MFGWRQSGAVDEAVLAELRAIRAEISKLTDRIAASPTRDELDAYVPRSEYEAHVSKHHETTTTQRWWATYGLGIAAIAGSPLLALLVAHLSVGWR